MVYETFRVYAPAIQDMYGCAHPRSSSIVVHLSGLDLMEDNIRKDGSGKTSDESNDKDSKPFKEATTNSF